jgi:hypothetical protein
MSLCILADAMDVDRAKQLDEELPFMTVEDLKKLNKVCTDDSEQEARQEARTEVRCFPRFRGFDQADSSVRKIMTQHVTLADIQTLGSWSLQGRKVPYPRLSL